MIGWRTAGAAVCLALVLVSYWGAYEHGRTTMDTEWRGSWAARDAGDKQAWALAEQVARKEELRRQAVVDEEESNARKQFELAAARAAAGGLRGEISRLRAGHSATCNANAAQQRQTGASAVVVLGGLLEDADRMAGSCAAALERSRIAGLAWESIMDGTRTHR
ncbi:DUF2514 domain-containing protein [Pseudomonas sp. SD17-1]|uniref:DUF2514 family protein n=1 Tax=Pseudomonas TaxID=286 RepID=UPI000998161F|nr:MULTISPECIES: DUF2514 family protein [Pseudomonas]MBG8559712.1 DUF2514 family protein [Pseudomonas qingdaonensis]OOW06551.1 hypothetical protein MF6396_02575 [Pseudomonas sp. MF6396]WEJ20082.1 DUF2514 domain-containing protein [Pseudomonas sp. SD17-1]